VHYAQDFHAIEERKIEDENSLESFNPKNSQCFQIRMLKPRVPPHVRLAGKKRECFVSCNQKAVAKFRGASSRI
jgi:hypothetical protein